MTLHGMENEYKLLSEQYDTHMRRHGSCWARSRR